MNESQHLYGCWNKVGIGEIAQKNSLCGCIFRDKYRIKREYLALFDVNRLHLRTRTQLINPFMSTTPALC